MQLRQQKLTCPLKTASALQHVPRAWLPAKTITASQTGASRDGKLVHSNRWQATYSTSNTPEQAHKPVSPWMAVSYFRV